jgi:adenylylsulfate kinase
MGLTLKGKVYWFTGLSGAGKTTLGTVFYSRLKNKKNNTVYLDGDGLRKIFTHTTGYSPEERKKLAMQYSNLCKMLSEQGINVVIATISMFHEIRDWNRVNINNYVEIYIKVSMDVLIRRDQKQLYSRALSGKIKHVMGVNENIEEPENPDFILYNDGDISPELMIDNLLSELKY